jgi:glycerol-3-phosphate dehydrogenase
LFGQDYDLAIIGGGLNGCAIARDAAGRGLAVFLCDQGDLGGGASSRTAKLADGGLHRLETLDLLGLREVLIEQRILLRAAPHVVSPLRFVLPHHERQWPGWALGLGLFAYDHVTRRNLPVKRRVDLEHDPAGAALNPNFQTGYEYSDCIADDARLVVLNAIDARARGASINPRLRCVVAERDGRAWRLSLESTETGERFTVGARTLVNATGPSSGSVLDHVVHSDQRAKPRLVKESHIIVVRHGQSGRAYTLPNADGRIVYALPYERDFMIIGTSSVDFDGDPNSAAIEGREIDYLLDVASQYFYRPIEWHDIVRGFSCVKAIHEDGESPRRVARDHLVAVEPGILPLVTVYGGSLTTHRRLAARAVDRLGKLVKVGPAWTHKAALPGGNFSEGSAADLARALQAAYPFLEPGHALRLAVTYGTRASNILTGARSNADLGARFGADLTEAEVNYLVTEEWARTAEDILWRRTKLGLHFTRADVAALDAWMAAGTGVAAASAAE